MLAQTRAALKEQFPDASVTDLAKKQGEGWKELDASEKQKYQALQAEDVERYHRDMEAAGLPLTSPARAAPSLRAASRSRGGSGRRGVRPSLSRLLIGVESSVGSNSTNDIHRQSSRRQSFRFK